MMDDDDGTTGSTVGVRLLVVDVDTTLKLRFMLRVFIQLRVFILRRVFILLRVFMLRVVRSEELLYWFSLEIEVDHLQERWIPSYYGTPIPYIVFAT